MVLVCTLREWVCTEQDSGGVPDPLNVTTGWSRKISKETEGRRPPDVSVEEYSKKKVNELRASGLIRLLYAFF